MVAAVVLLHQGGGILIIDPLQLKNCPAERGCRVRIFRAVEQLVQVGDAFLFQCHGVRPSVPAPDMERPASDLKPGALLAGKNGQLVVQGSDVQRSVVVAISDWAAHVVLSFCRPFARPEGLSEITLYCVRP